MKAARHAKRARNPELNKAGRDGVRSHLEFEAIGLMGLGLVHWADRDNFTPEK